MFAKIMGNAILFSEMTPPDGGEEVFNDWYDGHHTPSHVQGVPGFVSAMRYQSKLGPHYLAIYELTNAGALDHEEYKKRKLTPDNPTYQMLQSVSGFSRYICVERFQRFRENVTPVPIDAPVVLCEFFAVPKEQRSTFEEWYDREHIPTLLECPGWLMTRRLDVEQWDPEPYTHLILHYLSDDNALESETIMKSRKTKLGQALVEQPWFSPQLVTYHRRNDRFIKSG